MKLARSACDVVRHFLGDLRYGIRLAKQQFAFSILVIATMAIGIGTCTATFALVQAVLLKPLPYPRPEFLVSIRTEHPEHGRNLVFRTSTYRAMKQEARALQELTAIVTRTLEVETNAGWREVKAAFVSPSFFGIFLPRSQERNVFQAGDSRPGGTRTVLIGYQLWRDYFGSDPAVATHVVKVRGINSPLSTCSIVGVLPRQFKAPLADEDPQIWIAESFEHPEAPEWVAILGRLAGGSSPATAEAELEAIRTRVERGPGSDTPSRLRVVPLTDHLVAAVRHPICLLFLGGLVLLLAATANAVNLLSARTASRTSEMAIRAMLGGSRCHLYSQLLAEGLLLVVPAATLGLALAYGTIRLFHLLGSVGIPRRFEIGIDGMVVLFAIVVGLGAILLITLLPALRFSTLGLADVLSGTTTESARTATRGDVGRSLFVSFQISLALISSITSALLLRSFAKIVAIDLGFETRGLITASIVLPADSHLEPGGKASVYAQFIRELEQIPDVASAGLASYLPLSFGSVGTEFAAEGAAARFSGQAVVVEFTAVTPGYLETMKIPLVAGRYFDDRDMRQLSFIVSKKAARFLWGSENALGRRLLMGGKESGNPWSPVVGVVSDVRHHSIAREGEARVYFPLSDLAQMAVVARSRSGEPELLAAPMRHILERVDPRASFLDVQTMGQRVASRLSTMRMSFFLMTLLAATTLGLAIVGVYGATWYSVVSRGTELHIRLALGALPSDILWLVSRKMLPWVAAGVLVGTGGSLMLGRFLASLLFDVSAADPLAILVATTLVCGASAVAICVPTNKVIRLDRRSLMRW